MRSIRLWTRRMCSLWERVKAEAKRFAYFVGWENDQFDDVDY